MAEEASVSYENGLTWRFMGSYKWSFKSPNMGYNYSYPAYKLPMNLQVGLKASGLGLRSRSKMYLGFRASGAL